MTKRVLFAGPQSDGIACPSPTVPRERAAARRKVRAAGRWLMIALGPTNYAGVVLGVSRRRHGGSVVSGLI